MSKSNDFENGLLLLLFNNTDFAGVGDATGLQGSTTAGSLYVGLHTADPGEAGDQTTNEATYTGYARVAVARSGAGWTVATNTVTNAAAIEFGACTAGSETISYISVGTDSTGAGTLIYSGALTSNLAVSSGITPQFAAGELDVSED